MKIGKIYRVGPRGTVTTSNGWRNVKEGDFVRVVQLDGQILKLLPLLGENQEELYYGMFGGDKPDSDFLKEL